MSATWEIYDISGRLHIYNKKSNRLLQLGLAAEPYKIGYTTAGFDVDFDQLTDENRVSGENFISDLLNRGYGLECSDSVAQTQMASGSPLSYEYMNTNQEAFGEMGEEEEEFKPEPEPEAASFSWPVPTTDPIPIPIPTEDHQEPRPPPAHGYVRCTAEFVPGIRTEFVLLENLARALFKKDASLLVKECSKDETVRYQMVEKVVTEVVKESASLCSKTNGSVFMDTGMPLLSSDQMAEAAKQMNTNAPLIFKLLSAIGSPARVSRQVDQEASRRKLENCVLISAAILLKNHNTHASAFQSQLTKLVKSQGLSVQGIRKLHAFNITVHKCTFSMITDLVELTEQDQQEPESTGHLECSVFSRKFSRIQALNNHERWHGTLASLVCRICKKAFDSRYNFKRHMKFRHKNMEKEKQVHEDGE